MYYARMRIRSHPVKSRARLYAHLEACSRDSVAIAKAVEPRRTVCLSVASNSTSSGRVTSYCSPGSHSAHMAQCGKTCGRKY